MLPTSRSRAGKAGCPWHPASFRTLAVVTGLGMRSPATAMPLAWTSFPKAGYANRYACSGIVRRETPLFSRVAINRDEIDLEQACDHIFRMRRARRSCDLGLIQKACQDYAAIVWNA